MVEQSAMSRRIYGYTNTAVGFQVRGAPLTYRAIVLRRGEDFPPLRGDKLNARAAQALLIMLEPGATNSIDLISPREN